MTHCGDWPIGVCSWSLGTDFHRLNDLRSRTGIDRVHLFLNPFLEKKGNGEYSCLDFIQDGWTISATMIGFGQEDYSTLESIKQTGGIVPDAFWPENKALVFKAIEATASLNVPYLEFHAGFIDLSEPDYARKMSDRFLELADAARKNNVTILLETGQETAQTLRTFLARLDHPALGVNFDPANMVLYGKGEPVEALGLLSPWIRHVHIKDAVSSGVPGQWGTEVVWGEGDVKTELFLTGLKKNGFSGTLSIEREAGTQCLQDVTTAVQRLVAFKAGV